MFTLTHDLDPIRDFVKRGADRLAHEKHRAGCDGMVGLLLFLVVFRMRPADPPLDVMLIIFAIVTTSATLQAAGGLDYLVGIAERLIGGTRRALRFWALCIVFSLPVCRHLACGVLPAADHCRSGGKETHPSRTAAQHECDRFARGAYRQPDVRRYGRLCRPAGVPGRGARYYADLHSSCLLGVLAGCFSVVKMGKPLEQDPVFLQKMKDPLFAATIDTPALSKTEVKPGARTAVVIFGLAILVVVLAGAFPEWVPRFGAGKANFSISADGRLKMATIIEVVTLSAAAAILLFTKTAPVAVTQTSLFTAMAAAVVSVFGVVWMSATFMEHNEAVLRTALGGLAQTHPWTFAFAVFFMGILMFSQAATTRTMMPLGLTLGLLPGQLIPVFPAVNSDFVVPGYPTLLAAINFDRTGTTRIGKYVINHSFMRGGMVTLVTAIAVGFLLARLVL
jgi:anaerobic C4-dicarboxylate transporter DcuA